MQIWKINGQVDTIFARSTCTIFERNHGHFHSWTCAFNFSQYRIHSALCVVHIKKSYKLMLFSRWTSHNCGFTPVEQYNTSIWSKILFTNKNESSSGGICCAFVSIGNFGFFIYLFLYLVKNHKYSTFFIVRPCFLGWRWHYWKFRYRHIRNYCRKVKMCQSKLFFKLSTADRIRSSLIIAYSHFCPHSILSLDTRME